MLKPFIPQQKLQQVKRLIFSKQFKSFITKEKYTVLFGRKNRYLFILLSDIGFFKFNTTNNANIVGLHQIVAYITKGYKAFTSGFTITKNIHVHHIDSNPSNNTPSNLIYVTSQEHLLITQACDLNTDHIKVYTGDVCPFNSKGLPVLNQFQRLSNLVSKTITKTFKTLGISIKIRPDSIFKYIPQSYTFKRVNWCPTFVKHIIVAVHKKMCSDNSLSYI